MKTRRLIALALAALLAFATAAGIADAAGKPTSSCTTHHVCPLNGSWD